MRPAEWMSANGASVTAARVMNAVMTSFMYDAPSEPQTDTTSGLSGSSPSWRLASALEQAVNAPRTGVPVTTTFSFSL